MPGSVVICRELAPSVTCAAEDAFAWTHALLHMDALLSWAEANGADISRVRRHGERGLATVVDVHLGEVRLSLSIHVPRNVHFIDSGVTPNYQPCLQLPGRLLLHAHSNVSCNDSLAGHVSEALDQLGALGASDVTLLVLRLALERALGASTVALLRLCVLELTTLLRQALPASGRRTSTLCHNRSRTRCGGLQVTGQSWPARRWPLQWWTNRKHLMSCKPGANMLKQPRVCVLAHSR